MLKAGVKWLKMTFRQLNVHRSQHMTEALVHVKRWYINVHDDNNNTSIICSKPAQPCINRMNKNTFDQELLPSTHLDINITSIRSTMSDHRLVHMAQKAITTLCLPHLHFVQPTPAFQFQPSCQLHFRKKTKNIKKWYSNVGSTESTLDYYKDNLPP